MVVDYLQTCDFLVFISEASLKKLIRDEDCKILNAQTMAYGYISEKLSGRYQIIKELSKEGDSRNASMVRWMTVLTVYFLYQSVPDESIPERVRLNYEDVLKEIERVRIRQGQQHAHSGFGFLRQTPDIVPVDFQSEAKS